MPSDRTTPSSSDPPSTVLTTPPPPSPTRALAGEVRAALWSVPRLRRRLERPGPGLGRPYWVDVDGVDEAADPAEPADPADPAQLVTLLRCSGDRRALLDLAATEVTRPLPRTGPLWRAAVVTGADGAARAVVVVLHHVVADGVGGLALLGRLVDGDARRPAPPEDVVRQDRLPARTLLRDVWQERLRSVRRARAAVRTARRGRGELGDDGPSAARCSLCVPTGARRRIGTVRVPLDSLRAAAHHHRGTVNDALVVAVTGALGRLLAARGEHVGHLVVSVPVSARRTTTEADLGNQVGVMPVVVPLTGTTAQRFTAVAARTSRQKASGARGASSALVGPAFRALAAVHLFRWCIDRQRLVNTFLTNLVGPPEPVRLAGHRVAEVVPVTVTAGNVGVAFAAMSYAGDLTVTAIADPDVVPELDALLEHLRAELHAVASSSDPRPRVTPPGSSAP